MSETKHSVHVTATIKLSDDADEQMFTASFRECFFEKIADVASDATLKALIETNLQDNLVTWDCRVTAVNALGPMKAALKDLYEEGNKLTPSTLSNGFHLALANAYDALRLAEGEKE